jgi:hypothetical protein
MREQKWLDTAAIDSVSRRVPNKNGMSESVSLWAECWRTERFGNWICIRLQVRVGRHLLCWVLQIELEYGDWILTAAVVPLCTYCASKKVKRVRCRTRGKRAVDRTCERGKQKYRNTDNAMPPSRGLRTSSSCTYYPKLSIL